MARVTALGVAMLRCREVTEKASRYLDHELGWSDRMQMRIHLMMCRHCARYVRQLKAVVELLQEVRLEAPSDGEDRLVARMNAIKPDRTS